MVLGFLNIQLTYYNNLQYRRLYFQMRLFVGLSVCLLPGYLKMYCTNFIEIL